MGGGCSVGVLSSSDGNRRHSCRWGTRLSRRVDCGKSVEDARFWLVATRVDCIRHLFVESVRALVQRYALTRSCHHDLKNHAAIYVSPPHRRVGKGGAPLPVCRFSKAYAAHSAFIEVR
jgi:hypothetical protein